MPNPIVISPLFFDNNFDNNAEKKWGYSKIQNPDFKHLLAHRITAKNDCLRPQVEGSTPAGRTRDLSCASLAALRYFLLSAFLLRFS